MKKVLLLAAVVGMIGMTSCKKCGKCVVGGVEGTEFCSKDNKALYDAAKASCNAAGGSWEN